MYRVHRRVKATEVKMIDLLGRGMNVGITPCYPWRPIKPRSPGSCTKTHPKYGTFKIQDFLAFNAKPLCDQGKREKSSF